MSEEEKKKKIINIKSSVTVKKSQGFKEITHKSVAGLSDDEAIERFTVGNFGEDGQEKES